MERDESRVSRFRWRFHKIAALKSTAVVGEAIRPPAGPRDLIGSTDQQCRLLFFLTVHDCTKPTLHLMPSLSGPHLLLQVLFYNTTPKDLYETRKDRKDGYAVTNRTGGGEGGYLKSLLQDTEGVAL